MDTTSPLFQERLVGLSRQRAELVHARGAGVATPPATSLRRVLLWREAEEAAGPGASFAIVQRHFAASGGDTDPGPPMTPALARGFREHFAYFFGGRHYNTDFVLATPAIPPLLRHELKRLRGDKPFARHRVMFVGHGYSDAVPWVETFLEAGADPLRTVFVPTNYAFHTAVADQLTFRGVLVHDFPMRSIPQAQYERVVEEHLRQLLSDARRDDDPVLIMDDGGVATRLVATKFASEAHRVTIVEQTDAGHRQAERLKSERGPLPFTYFSMARDWVKREVTSPRFAGRVVDRVYRHLDVNDLELRAKTAVVIGGGGAMGLPAAVRLRADGFRVRVIEQHLTSANAARARAAGFDVVTIDGGRALTGAALILGMTGETVIGPEHMAHVDDGAVFAQGSSKRREFDMDGLERTLNKHESPFSGMPTSKQYFMGDRSVHFILDGWTVNHANTFHGQPMRDLQLELATYFETAVAAVRAPASARGGISELPERRQRALVRLDAASRDRIPDSVTPASVNPFDRIY